ncbi:Integrase family protein [Candidatus Competibacter denitrificans Run_A_D11]|uniref:Integrase family protein n=1 Tax=Candidatus Competibacter denitrificans Run_A_D11 TaxID=1400863 RepID=W6M6X9_9GAMM|nr:site-specific integrase [Candidatus Competibacter denitrificans]CDI03661.1 Integrase family protein [Candidatus Competibacter denitrificans Run_A_D11]HRC68341.1 site-specific integrase [Candidatus Competibacter denitrificans]
MTTPSPPSIAFARSQPGSPPTSLAPPLPLERLRLPDELDGRVGVNRAGPDVVCQLAASNDLQAVQAWLAEFHDSPQTLRNYRKEAERLLLWALMERGKPLSSLTREDCLLYETFLVDPQPRERWCGQKAPRFSSRWRPFLGPLNPASRKVAMLIVNSLFSYLVKAGYLAGNPLALARRRNRNQQSLRQVERFLEHDQWQTLLATVEELPRDEERDRQHHARAKYLFALLYLLGPRVSEVANHTMSSFTQIRGRWWWRVIGKGRKEAQVPVNQDMLHALRDYRRFYGLSPMPAPDDATPLVLNLKGTGGIGDNMIYRIIKELVAKAANRLEADDPYQAEKLRRASTHWFRHTSITHQADAGIEIQFLQRNARHARIDTTGLYLHAEEKEWHETMERHRLKE